MWSFRRQVQIVQNVTCGNGLGTVASSLIHIGGEEPTFGGLGAFELNVVFLPALKVQFLAIVRFKCRVFVVPYVIDVDIGCRSNCLIISSWIGWVSIIVKS